MYPLPLLETSLLDLLSFFTQSRAGVAVYLPPLPETSLLEPLSNFVFPEGTEKSPYEYLSIIILLTVCTRYNK